MNSASNTDLLEALLPAWKRRLQAWCLDGSLSTATREALVLAEPPATLQDLLGSWSQGEFSTLPPIVLLPAAAMNGAAGAYAISRRTIVLNADWLVVASPEHVLAVLSEELGHHLDGLLNASDTPGDEGELFAALLHGEGAISAEKRQRLLTENDQGSVLVNGEALAVERARLVSTPIPVSRPGRSLGEVRNASAFAALRSDGSVVTWGNPASGGDSSAVAGQLNSAVTQIFSNEEAFAALKSNGSVVTWGKVSSGGDSRQLAGQLSSDVQRIFSTGRGFAALKGDGSVITWGDPSAGGDSRAVTGQLSSGVSQIFSNQEAFAALMTGGSVVTWGNASAGGDSDAVANMISSGITQIVSTASAFAALKADGSVVTWGNAERGGNSNGVAGSLSSGVTKIFANNGAFAALKADGSVVTWGADFNGGDSSAVFDLLRSNVSEIVCIEAGFAALKTDGSVVGWGFLVDFSYSSELTLQLSSGVSKIVANSVAFAALKTDGSVVTWGYPPAGGYSTEVTAQLRSGVTEIYATGSAFAALKRDGSVATWGSWGGDSSGVANQLRSGVRQLVATERAFAALKADGSVVTWGDAAAGGDSSGVAAQLNNVVAFANPLTDDQLVMLDQEPLPSISLAISQATVAEDGLSRLIYTFERSGKTLKELTINYSVKGSAMPGADYTGIASPATIKTVTFAVGSASASVIIEPIADNLIEPDESIVLSLETGEGYTIATAADVVGVIFNDDGYTSGPTTIKGINLGSTINGYALRRIDGQLIQVSFAGGYASASNPGEDWSAIAAASTKTGFALYWRNSSRQQAARWNLNANGVYESGYYLSGSALLKEEAALALDLNGDGYTAGPNTINGLNLGSTSIGYAIRRGNATPVQISSGDGSFATANNPGDWLSVLAAVPAENGASLYWRHINRSVIRWDLNTSGASQSGYILSASQLISTEASLNLDLNGDGEVGVSLSTTNEGYALSNGSASSIQVVYPGGYASSTNPGDGWIARAVTSAGSGYTLYWANRGRNEVIIWNLNDRGTYESGTLLSSSQLFAEEAGLKRDLNGDGCIAGSSTINGLNLGITSQGYCLSDGSANLIQVSWSGGNAADDNPGNGWVATAAIATATGSRLYWRNNSSNQQARWDLNASGSYQTGTYLSSEQLYNEEEILNADLNGDSIIGASYTAIESQGNATLLRRNDGQSFVESDNTRTRTRSPFNLGTEDNSNTWQMLAAETVDGQNQILWRNNPGNFLHVWTLDSSWNWQSSSGNFAPTSAAALGLETNFQVDLNGNGVIG